jgi:hypothetical protein
MSLQQSLQARSPELDRFLRMLQVGVPEEAVRHKLAAEGITLDAKPQSDADGAASNRPLLLSEKRVTAATPTAAAALAGAVAAAKAQPGKPSRVRRRLYWTRLQLPALPTAAPESATVEATSTSAAVLCAEGHWLPSCAAGAAGVGAAAGAGDGDSYTPSRRGATPPERPLTFWHSVMRSPTRGDQQPPCEACGPSSTLGGTSTSGTSLCSGSAPFETRQLERAGVLLKVNAVAIEALFTRANAATARVGKASGADSAATPPATASLDASGTTRGQESDARYDIEGTYIAQSQCECRCRRRSVCVAGSRDVARGTPPLHALAVHRRSRSLQRGSVRQCGDERFHREPK